MIIRYKKSLKVLLFIAALLLLGLGILYVQKDTLSRMGEVHGKKGSQQP
ncbi:hypothetical protein [Pedobacter sp. R20-19]|nr:hypothetical protein [Pedobacter sp. R20-19]